MYLQNLQFGEDIFAAQVTPGKENIFISWITYLVLLKTTNKNQKEHLQGNTKSSHMAGI